MCFSYVINIIHDINFVNKYINIFNFYIYFINFYYFVQDTKTTLEISPCHLNHSSYSQN